MTVFVVADVPCSTAAVQCCGTSLTHVLPCFVITCIQPLYSYCHRHRNVILAQPDEIGEFLRPIYLLESMLQCWNRIFGPRADEADSRAQSQDGINRSAVVASYVNLRAQCESLKSHFAAKRKQRLADKGSESDGETKAQEEKVATSKAESKIESVTGETTGPKVDAIDERSANLADLASQFSEWEVLVLICVLNSAITILQGSHASREQRTVSDLIPYLQHDFHGREQRKMRAASSDFPVTNNFADGSRPRISSSRYVPGGEDVTVKLEPGPDDESDLMHLPDDVADTVAPPLPIDGASEE